MKNNPRREFPQDTTTNEPTQRRYPSQAATAPPIGYVGDDEIHVWDVVAQPDSTATQPAESATEAVRKSAEIARLELAESTPIHARLTANFDPEMLAEMNRGLSYLELQVKLAGGNDMIVSSEAVGELIKEVQLISSRRSTRRIRYTSRGNR